jgi:hypothetical protein
MPTPATSANSSQSIALSSASAALAGADQEPESQQVLAQESPETGSAAGALSGDFAVPAPPLTQRIADSTNNAAANHPAPQKPGAWAQSILGGVMDALSGFVAGGGAGEQAAQNQQRIQAERNQQKQLAVENQQKQQQLNSDIERNDILNAYTTAATVADQKTAARLDQESMDQHVAAGKVAAAAFKNHPVIADNVLEDDVRPEFKSGGRFDPHKTIGFQTGETQVEKNGKIVTEPTYTIFSRQAGQVDIDAPTSALLTQHGQPLPEGTHIDSDILNHLVTQAIASQTTTNLVNSALKEQTETELDLLKDQASVQNLKDRAAVNPYLGAHPGDPIEALSDLSQQKDPKTKQLTPQAQAASRMLSQWDPKELEDYRHNKAEERTAAATESEKVREFNLTNDPQMAASIAQDLVEHNMDPEQLSKRATKGSDSYNRILEAANTYSMNKFGVPYDIAQATTDYKQAQNPQVQATLKLLNSVGPNLQEVLNASNKLPRTQYPALNDVQAWARLQTGNPDITAFHTAAVEVGDQIAKILQGGTGSSTSDAKLKQASDILNSSFTPQQLQANITTLNELLGNRKAAIIGDNSYLKKQFSPQAQNPSQASAQTHIFDPQAWATANPGKDVNAAIAFAKTQGFQVKGQ